MSTPTPTPPSKPASAAPSAERQITLISHSPLFYWWPVWALGFFMALWTYIEDHRMAILPTGTQARVALKDGERPQRYELDLTDKRDPTYSLDYATSETKREAGAPSFPVRVSQHAWLGSVFILVLLMTIVITSVPLRGLLSFFVIIIFVVIGLLFSVFHIWDTVFDYVQSLRVFINLGGYVFIAVSVFVIWAASTWLFDRQAYMIVSPGQIKVCEHIGDSVRTYDTQGITFEKQRDDLFRHYILGFGSGDLIVRTSGAEQHKIYFPNVLGIGWKLPAIEDMIKERPTAV